MAWWRLWTNRSASPIDTSNNKKLQRIARKHYNEKNFHLAAPLLEEILANDGDNIWALDVYSRLLMNIKSHDKAIPFLEKIATPGPDRPIYLRRIARCLQYSRRYRESVELLEKMVYDSEMDDEGWKLLHQGLEMIFTADEIDSFWNKLALSSISDPEIELQMIRIDLKSSELTSAAQRIKLVTDAANEIQLTDKWKLKLAIVLLKEGAPWVANEIVESVPKDTPDYTKTVIKILTAVGDNDGAMRAGAMSLEGKIDPGEMFGILRLAWDLGDLEEVIRYSNVILSLKPDQRIAHRFRLQALVKIGDIDRIKVAVNNSLRELPDFIEAHRVMIDIAYSVFQDWKLAITHCNLILKIEPNDRRSYSHLIHSMLELDRYDEAARLIEKATEIHPENDEIDLTAAQAYWRMGEGDHIGRINRMLARHDLFPIYSMAKNQSIAVEHLRCDAPSSNPKNNPLVSVIMTVYEKDQYLDVAIDAILGQTHQNLELIIVDDCSPDDAFEYLQMRATKEDKLTVIQVEQNGGTYCAKNTGLTIANGDFIAFMDSDDWTHPQRIEYQIKQLQEDSKVQAVWNSNFRIDENGNIIFKGWGSIRKACISLLCRKEVFEILGFFDSLRVGADSELIERIKAYWGEQGVLYDQIPTMFMLQHTTSLTGGGPFHIDWRSISGKRLEHHSSFKTWHKKIRHSGQSPYMDFPLKVRPFTVPVDMMAGQSHWKDEMKLFSELLYLRNKKWRSKVSSPPWQSKISNRMDAALWVKEQSVNSCEIVWSGHNLSEMPSLKQFPERISIRADKGFGENDTLWLKNGKGILDGKLWDNTAIKDNFTSDEFLNRIEILWSIEKLPKPEILSEDELIPRIWKFYCFGGEIALIHVELKLSSNNPSENIHHYFEPNLRQLRKKIHLFHSVPNEPLYFPNCWDEMVEQVTKLGMGLGCFMRIDMFATENGPVFDKFVLNPEDGEGFTEYTEKYLATFWNGLGGCE